MKKFMVLIFALAMVVAFTVPTYAAFTYTFKGDARMNTYTVNQSKEYTGTGEDDRDTLWAKDDVLTRFSITAKSENIKGYIELRSNTGSYVRHWFGEYDFGAGKLLVGKTWPVNKHFTSGQNYDGNGTTGYGRLGWRAARIDQIRFTFGDFVLGFLSPPAGTNPGVPNLQDYDRTIPNIEASYTFKFDTIKLQVDAGYGTYEVDTTTGQSYDVTSYFVGLAAYCNFGPVYVNIDGNISQNADNYGLKYNVDAGANFSGNEIKDNDGYGYFVAVGYKINDMLKMEAGYGYLQGEDDLPNVKEDSASWMYVMLPISVAPGVTISPEIGKIDEEKNSAGVEEGDQTYIGATWKIAF